MTLFEYLTVIFSIVLGLSLTHLLREVRNVFTTNRRYWVHCAFYLLLLLLHPQLWWALWDLQSDTEWTFLSFMFTLMGPALLYMISTSLIPTSHPATASWQDYFEEARTWFYALFALYALWGMLIAYWMMGTPFFHPYRIVQLLMFIPAVYAIFSRSRKLDGVLAVCFLATFVVSQLVFRILPGGYNVG